MQQTLLYTGNPPMGMAEVLVLTPHHPGLTHLDALVHVPVDGLVYPERPRAEAVTPAAVRHGSTTAFADGVWAKMLGDESWQFAATACGLSESDGERVRAKLNRRVKRIMAVSAGASSPFGLGRR